jgi:hypothetical protein
VPLTLVFAHAGTRNVAASVAKLGAMHADETSKSPNASHMPGMSAMPGMH